jgi:hypothetical protein
VYFGGVKSDTSRLISDFNWRISSIREGLLTCLELLHDLGRLAVS